MRGRTIKLALGIPVALLALVSAGTWAYIEFVHGDAPDRLSLDAADGSTTTTAVGGTDADGTDGTWQVADGSQAGYRVDEILFGQDATAVGRTEDVTGSFELRGTTVTAAEFTVDMTTVRSDESRRDNQFRGRIMDTTRYPTATFILAEPLPLGDVPAVGGRVQVSAVGDLTLRGTTKRVRVDLDVERSAGTARVAGTFPIVFEDWGIPNPSFGPARTEDHGELELLLVFRRAG